MKRLRIAASMLLAIILIALSASFAFADTSDDETYTDAAGNYFFAGSAQTYTNQSFDNTFFWAGQDLTLDTTDILNGSFIAGQNLSLNSVVSGGNTFIAGQHCTVKDSTLIGNIFAAGQSIDISNTQVRAVYAAGEDIAFDGLAYTLFLAGNNVSLSGDVEGDAHIAGENITIQPGTVVTGKLTVESNVEPALPADSSIGSYEFVPSESKGFNTDEVTNLVAAGSAASLAFSIVACLACAVIGALLIFWLNRRTLTTAADYFRNRPMPLFVSGLVLVVVLPLVVIIGFVALSWKISLSLILAASIIGLLSVIFTGASLGQMILPKLPPLGSAILGAIVASIVAIIPFIGALMSIFAALYAAGYVVQWVWLNGIQHKPGQPQQPLTADRGATADYATAQPIPQVVTTPDTTAEAIPTQPGSQA